MPEFIKNAGENIGKVAAGYPYNPGSSDPRYLEFKRLFYERFGQAPETYAAHAYDGMCMLIKAIEKAGLNRARIRDELAKMKHYDGVTGKKEFDAVFNNISPAALAVLKNRRWVFYSQEEALK